MKLSLVIPCYNEAANLPLLVPRCREVAQATGGEVILVDNGSKDATPSVLEALLAGQEGVRSVRVEVNQGYGFGILSGLRAAQGDVLAWTHADMQTDPMDVARGLEFFTSAADPKNLFVKGRRYGRPPGDVFFTMGMSVFETALLNTRLWDINAQPTMFSRAFFETWAQPPHDFSLDLYAYWKARHDGLTVSRFPVRFGARAHGVSSWNVNWAAKRKFIERTVSYSLQLRKDISQP
jgi:glycosyltransferase involved in cell wall biosynthesis